MERRSIVMVAGAMLLGIGGGAFAARTPAATPAASKPAQRMADTTKTHAPPATDSTRGRRDTASMSMAHDASAAKAAAPSPVDTMTPSVADTTPAAHAREDGRARVAKLFGTMPANDAARVMEQMPDSEVIVILRSMRGRQAAGIVSQLDAKRAATIGRALLHDGGR